MRIMGKDLSDSKIVENVFVSLPKRFGSKFSSLEDSKDINELPLSDLINYVQEERIEQRDEKKMMLKEIFSQNFKRENNLYYVGSLQHQCFKCKRFTHVQKYSENNTEENVNKIQVFDGWRTILILERSVAILELVKKWINMKLMRCVHRSNLERSDAFELWRRVVLEKL